MVESQVSDTLQFRTAKSANLSFLIVAPENIILIFPVDRTGVVSLSSDLISFETSQLFLFTYWVELISRIPSTVATKNQNSFVVLCLRYEVDVEPCYNNKISWLLVNLFLSSQARRLNCGQSRGCARITSNRIGTFRLFVAKILFTLVNVDTSRIIVELKTVFAFAFFSCSRYTSLIIGTESVLTLTADTVVSASKISLLATAGVVSFSILTLSLGMTFISTGALVNVFTQVSLITVEAVADKTSLSVTTYSISLTGILSCTLVNI